VLMLEMDGIEVPIQLDVEQFEQFAKVIEAHKPIELDVDEMTARKPNALEIDKRFFLRVSSGKSKIDWMFGRDQAEGLHQQLGGWLSELPPRKTH